NYPPPNLQLRPCLFSVFFHILKKSLSNQLLPFGEVGRGLEFHQKPQHLQRRHSFPVRKKERLHEPHHPLKVLFQNYSKANILRFPKARLGFRKTLRKGLESFPPHREILC